MAILADSFYYQELRIDTINTRVFADLVAKEGDANGRGLLVTLTENGLMKDTTGITLILKWEHTSVGNQGLDNFEAVDPSKGLYKITYPTEMLNRGTVRAFIQIIDSGKLAGTRNIEITVDRGVGDDTAIASSNSFTALAQALIDVNSNNSALSARITSVEQELAATVNDIDTSLTPRILSVEQDLVAVKSTDTSHASRILSVEQQLAETGKRINNFSPILQFKTDNTTGFQFDKTNAAMIAHKNSYSTVPLTIDLLIGMGAETLDFTGVTELMLASKSNSWALKISPDGKFAGDVFKAGANWAGAITSKTQSNFHLLKETTIESYGVSQGITTDGAYLYTSNNRLDMNSYNVHKRKLDGTLIKGIVLDVGYTHPCGMCTVGGLLYVPANNYPNNVVDHRIYVIDTLDMSIVDEIQLTLNSGGGISGLAYNNGYFYACDWQTGANTNIYIYDNAFNLVATKQIDTRNVQGIDISGNTLIAVSVTEESIITYDLATMIRRRKYTCYSTIEKEDICITAEGTILNGDVSTIREYAFAESPPTVDYAAEHYERLTLTIASSGGTVTYKLYRNGLLQGQNSFVGTLNNLSSYGLGINGNIGFTKTAKFKLKALGISNSILVPTKNIKEVMDKSRYGTLYVDGFITSDTIKDNSTTPSAIAITGSIKNANIFEL